MGQDEIMEVLSRYPQGITQIKLKRIMGRNWIDVNQIRYLINKGLVRRIPTVEEGTNTWFLIPIQKPEDKLIIHVSI